MGSAKLLLLLPLAAALCHVSSGIDAWVSLTYVPASFEIKHGHRPADSDDVVAWGSFENAINETGFGYLEIYTNERLPDEYQAYAAGFLEGYLTRDLIRMHFDNQWTDYCVNETGYCKRLYDFFSENVRHMNGQAEQYRSSSAYWHQVDLILNQMAGLDDARKGYTQYFPSWSYVNATDLLFLNADGDLEDLEAALKRRVGRKVLGSGSCSALVKVLPGNRDIYFSQVTWSTYASMLRILKKYSLRFHKTFQSSELIPGHTLTFSSAPGRIFSGDDFYLISSGLATMETTIGNGNPDLYQYITPQTNLEFVRNIVANRLATTGKEWSDLFAEHNSGTYNNQWMVLDYKKFKPGQPLPDGLLYVLEQLPHYINITDATDVLRNQSYWPSYNVPASQFIFNMSGSQKQVEKFGDWFTYDKTPRALIFKRDNGNVHDMDSMIKLMRYNDYKNDPLSRCNCTPPYSAENAISARSDLNPPDGTYPFGALGHRAHGSTDMKHATDGSSGSTRSSANVLSTGSLSQNHHSDLQLQPEDAEQVALHIRRMASTVPDLVRVAQQRLVAQREAEASNIVYFTCGFCFLVTLSAALVFYEIAREAMWRPTQGKTETDTVPSTTIRSTPGVSATSSAGAPGTAVTSDATT